MFHFSKSKYTSFIQCPKMLWLKTYRPELAEEDASAQDRMTKGNVVGDLAMGLFGAYIQCGRKCSKRPFHTRNFHNNSAA